MSRTTPFNEEKIMEVRQDVNSILRTHAIIAARMHELGMPEDMTVEELAEFVDNFVAELLQRRIANDGAVSVRLSNFAATHLGVGYTDDIDYIFEAMEDHAKVYKSFQSMMYKFGQAAVLNKIEDAAEA